MIESCSNGMSFKQMFDFAELLENCAFGELTYQIEKGWGE